MIPLVTTFDNTREEVIAPQTSLIWHTFGTQAEGNKKGVCKLPEIQHLQTPSSAYGESGIRTRGTGFSPYTGLANRRLQPLGHLS